MASLSFCGRLNHISPHPTDGQNCIFRPQRHIYPPSKCEGSNTSIITNIKAVIQQFGTEGQLFPQSSIDDCFKVVDSEEVDFAVVPFENSTNGQVVFTCDLLRDWFILSRKPLFKIVGEQFVLIHHCLLTNATKLEDINTVYSHPQVWTQVDKFTSSKGIFDGVKKIDTLSTSKAAEMVSQDSTNTSACISSQISAELYKLPVMYANIENVENNTTRFLILGRKSLEGGADAEQITSMMFTLDHNDPGALCDVLNSFKKHNVNLTSIHSRPSHMQQWQYVFFVEASADEKSIEESVKEIKQRSLELAVMGTFKRSWRYRRDE